MIAYTITSQNKVWMIDEANGDTIPPWCYNKEGYFVVEELPDDVKALLDSQNLEKASSDKLKEVNTAFNKEMALIASEYPELERLSWDKQEKEARDYTADNNTSTPLIDEIAKARDISKDDLVVKIIEKADAYAVASGVAIGKRQLLEEKITEASTIEDIEAIKWE